MYMYIHKRSFFGIDKNNITPFKRIPAQLDKIITELEVCFNKSGITQNFTGYPVDLYPRELHEPALS